MARRIDGGVAPRKLNADQLVALNNPNVHRSSYRDGSEQIEIGVGGGHVLMAFRAAGATSFTFGNVSSPEYLNAERLYEMAGALRALAILTETK